MSCQHGAGTQPGQEELLEIKPSVQPQGCYTKLCAFTGSPNTPSSFLPSPVLHSSSEKSPGDRKYKSVCNYRPLFKYRLCLKGPGQNSLTLSSEIKFCPFRCSIYLIRKHCYWYKKGISLRISQEPSSLQYFSGPANKCYDEWVRECAFLCQPPQDNLQ